MTRLAILVTDQESVVVFDHKVENPWQYLNQIAKDVPQMLDKPVRFSRRLPQNETASYVTWEAGNSCPQVGKTFREAIRFLKPKKPLRTLGELLAKYAAK